MVSRVPMLHPPHKRHSFPRAAREIAVTLIYSLEMDFAIVLREIDAEIERLVQTRAIVASLATPVRSPQKRTRAPLSQSAKPVPAPQVPAEPRLVVLPPRRKREYAPRKSAVAPKPKSALGPAPTERLVIIPRPTASASPAKPAAPPQEAADRIEAAMRRNLMG